MAMLQCETKPCTLMPTGAELCPGQAPGPGREAPRTHICLQKWSRSLAHIVPAQQRRGAQPRWGQPPRGWGGWGRQGTQPRATACPREGKSGTGLTPGSVMHSGNRSFLYNCYHFRVCRLLFLSVSDQAEPRHLARGPRSGV